MASIEESQGRPGPQPAFIQLRLTHSWPFDDVPPLLHNVIYLVTGLVLALLLECLVHGVVRLCLKPEVKVGTKPARRYRWGTHTIAVNSGLIGVEVRLAGPAARVSFNAAPGTRVRLEYVAPITAFAPKAGKLTVVPGR